MPRDEATVLDILRAADLVERFLLGFAEDAFMEDLKTQAAVIREIEIVGEAARRLSSAFRERRADIPWRAIIGMRDKLIHGYDAVDMVEVWTTAQSDIPALAAALRREVAPLE